jgi:hypothetical protein
VKKRPRLEAQSSGPSLVDAVAESGRQLLEGVRALLQSEGLTPATRQQVGTLIYDLQSEVGRGVSAAATCPWLALLEDHSGEAEGAEDEEEEGEEEDEQEKWGGQEHDDEPAGPPPPTHTHPPTHPPTPPWVLPLTPHPHLRPLTSRRW